LWPEFLLAHNPDTSYARITISSNAVEFKFTYDIVTLRLITEIDADGDERVTRSEIASQAAAIHDYLRRRIFLELNTADAQFAQALPPTWPEDAGEAIEKKDWHQRLISFTFRNAVEATPTDVALVFDVFQDFNDRHTILGVFVHGSEEHPVIFTRFEPDYLYDTTYVPGKPATNAPLATATNVVPAAAPDRPPLRRSTEQTTTGWMGRFLLLGVEHIFLGYDHILFLLGLIVVGKFWDLVKIVTSFTIAHTITLVLATLKLVSIEPRLIETGIALTIVYVASENLWTREPKHRWVLTFAFGLVHGFGFANVLREMELPSTGLMQSLLAFNVGVEIGQVIIVAALWPVLAWVHKQKWAPKAVTGLSIVILALGAAWFVERALGLEYMPF
jgi:hypothetical protein